MPLQILLAADHAGFFLKEHLIVRLQEEGYRTVDKGCYSDRPVDYPDYAAAVAEVVSNDPEVLGILIFGTGIGMSIAANKVPNVRAALCHDPYGARLAREHNKSNILCLGANSIGTGLAEAIVSTWLHSSFSNAERHIRRFNQVAAMESRQ